MFFESEYNHISYFNLIIVQNPCHGRLQVLSESNPSYHNSFSGLSLVDRLDPPGMSGSYLRYPPLPGNPMATAGSIPGDIAFIMQPKDIKTVPEDELIIMCPQPSSATPKKHGYK